MRTLLACNLFANSLASETVTCRPAMSAWQTSGMLLLWQHLQLEQFDAHWHRRPLLAACLMQGAFCYKAMRFAPTALAAQLCLLDGSLIRAMLCRGIYVAAGLALQYSSLWLRTAKVS